MIPSMISLHALAENSKRSIWDIAQHCQANESIYSIKEGEVLVPLNFTIGEEEKENKRKRETEKSTKGAKTYDYPNKTLWRNRWFSFLEKNIEINQDTKILSLLGPELLELPGYDNLGITRENVYCAESDPSRIRKIQEQKSGVHLHPGKILDFLLQTEEKFDAILLDYDGSITKDKVRALEIITQRQLLCEKSVLGLNVFGSRECAERQMLYVEPFIEVDLESLVGSGSASRDVLPPEITKTSRDLNGFRDYGITALVLKMLMGHDATSINKQTLSLLPREEKEAWKKYIGDNSPKTYKDFITLNDSLRSYVSSTLDSTIPEIAKLAFIISIASAEAYFPQSMERICYKTQGNNRFFSDFYALDQRSDLFDVLANPKVKTVVNGSQKFENFVQKYSTSMDQRRKRRIKHQIEVSSMHLLGEYSGFFVSDAIPKRRDIAA